MLSDKPSKHGVHYLQIRGKDSWAMWVNSAFSVNERGVKGSALAQPEGFAAREVTSSRLSSTDVPGKTGGQEGL